MKEKHTYHQIDVAGSLPQTLRVNPYTVPDGYFERLQQHTLQRCQHRYGDAATFRVPTGYFDRLPDRITAKIAEQELKSIVPHPGFVAPEGYFDKLPSRIIERATYRAATPVRKLDRPKWALYAAAASIVLMLGLAGVLRLATNTPETESPLASVSDQQILDYLELYGAPNDMIYISEQLEDFDEGPHIDGEISADDIEAYLNHTL